MLNLMQLITHKNGKFKFFRLFTFAVDKEKALDSYVPMALFSTKKY